MPSFAVGHSYLVRVEMNIDLNKPQVLTRETIAALVFAAAGMYWAYWGDWFLGASGLLLAIGLGFLYKGIGFDLSGKRYRTYTGLFSWRLGSWQPLPTITGVTLKYFSGILISGKPGRMREDKAGYLVLMLSVQNSPQGIILQRFSIKEEAYAIEIGQEVAQRLAVPLAKFLPQVQGTFS